MILVVSDHSKPDPTYYPQKNARSQRWHVRLADREFELLTTDSKWWDCRRGIGGCGAIDLAKHLTGKTFKQVVRQLLELGL